ncbi:hypothetical protein PR048_025710 [Dryococelus australis]|uniref:Uncharacterized protein n=1 Tax=Dryococelus australis TaxID=614101 RepID=A0ABQ9GJC3_9NEOP|nr:hypothetical protein PR048_025710 [Dryococelus australis]
MGRINRVRFPVKKTNAMLQKGRLQISPDHEQSVSLSIALYVYAVWYLKARLVHIQKLLLQKQRIALFAITKSYRTISTEALQVVAGIIPPRSVSNITRNQKKVSGPLVVPSLENETDYHLSQMLTGHGNFKAYLYISYTLCKICNTEDTNATFATRLQPNPGDEPEVLAKICNEAWRFECHLMSKLQIFRSNPRSASPSLHLTALVSVHVNWTTCFLNVEELVIERKLTMIVGNSIVPIYLINITTSSDIMCDGRGQVIKMVDPQVGAIYHEQLTTQAVGGTDDEALCSSTLLPSEEARSTVYETLQLTLKTEWQFQDITHISPPSNIVKNGLPLPERALQTRAELRWELVMNAATPSINYSVTAGSPIGTVVRREHCSALLIAAMAHLLSEAVSTLLLPRLSASSALSTATPLETDRVAPRSRVWRSNRPLPVVHGARKLRRTETGVPGPGFEPSLRESMLVKSGRLTGGQRQDQQSGRKQTVGSDGPGIHSSSRATAQSVARSRSPRLGRHGSAVTPLQQQQQQRLAVVGAAGVPLSGRLAAARALALAGACAPTPS